MFELYFLYLLQITSCNVTYARWKFECSWLNVDENYLLNLWLFGVYMNVVDWVQVL
jgi:hypothetical protein